eukprot:COSAG04_NODE_310_length_17225_cov_12.768014_5_plen_59_part_00
MVALPSGEGVVVTYTWNRVRIKCGWISEEELQRRAVAHPEPEPDPEPEPEPEPEANKL